MDWSELIHFIKNSPKMRIQTQGEKDFTAYCDGGIITCGSTAYPFNILEFYFTYDDMKLNIWNGVVGLEFDIPCYDTDFEIII